MLKYISARRLAVPFILTAALLSGACGNKDKLTTDSAMARDLEIAKKENVPPTLTDVPPTTTTPPRTTTPPVVTPPRATTPPATGGNTRVPSTGGSERTGVIAAGTQLSLTSGMRVCTNTHKAGDIFTATLTESVTGSNGVIIPAGTTAQVEVTAVKTAQSVNDKPVIVLAVQSITVNGKTYPINSEIVSADVTAERAAQGGSDAKKVIGGAVIGAIAGQIIGKNTKATVIGGAAGAAAGTAVAIATGNSNGCIPEGGKIGLKLNDPLTITKL